MSHGGEIFGLGGDAASEPSFETALRGYEKKQVERYVARAENEIAALASEREQAYSQIQAMAGQIDRLQQEVAQARRQPGARRRGLVPAPRPPVEQILAMAEEVAADDQELRHRRHRRPARRGRAHPRRGRGARPRRHPRLRDRPGRPPRRGGEGRRRPPRRRREGRSAASRQSAEQMRGRGRGHPGPGAAPRPSSSPSATAQEAQRVRAEADGYVKSTRVAGRAGDQGAGATRPSRRSPSSAPTPTASAASSRPPSSTNSASAARRSSQELGQLRDQRREAVRRPAQRGRPVRRGGAAPLRRAGHRHPQGDRRPAGEDHRRRPRPGGRAGQGRRGRAEVTPRPTSARRPPSARPSGCSSAWPRCRSELEAELKHVAEAKRAGEAAERHATDVRRQVQKEAKRVAELAAAAVLAAAASPDDDDDYQSEAESSRERRRSPRPRRHGRHPARPVPPRATRVAAPASPRAAPPPRRRRRRAGRLTARRRPAAAATGDRATSDQAATVTGTATPAPAKVTASAKVTTGRVGADAD